MSNDKYVAYVSSYTNNAKSKGYGIHIYDMDVDAGRVTERSAVKINNSSYVILYYLPLLFPVLLFNKIQKETGDSLLWLVLLFLKCEQTVADILITLCGR